MRSLVTTTAAILAASTYIAGAANAQCVPSSTVVCVTGDITTSQTWTADKVYKLEAQIYVRNGATLTIEAGTLIASRTNIGGSLAVTRGSQIHVLGTQAQPVIFTSEADVATWVGGDPRTGTWREAANEWGNLTIMGSGYIAENAIPTNTPFPSATNEADMEGLINGPATDRYGGGNDDDDSGTIRYASFRYGGKVVGLANELNGLSLGGVGRETDIHHVEIMNNVDDGVEIWGGKVNLKYVSIWNIGDDSIDVDQGWRGKIQFGLIVQGHSLNASQGSGVGDNCFETDGAEQCDYQPLTTATIYNCTVIGQPVDGDHGTAWRDNARVQYRNCVFMDLGERLVQFDNVDGDGGLGYGCNGTLSWANTWTTDYNAVPAFPFSDPNPPIPGFYSAQTSGKLAEIKDSVFFRNQFATAYTEATARGVLDPSTNNVLTPGFDPLDAPIQAITRGPAVVKGGKTMLPVILLDPRPANAALTSVASAPNDGFFTPAAYRGAFAPGAGQTWLCDWTASYAFGFTPCVSSVSTYCTAGTSTNGCSALMSANVTTPSLSAGAGSFVITASSVEGQKLGLIFYGVNGPAAGTWGTSGSFLCVKAPTQRLASTNTGGTASACDGSLSMDFFAYMDSHPFTLGQPIGVGQAFNAQAWYRDPPSVKTTHLSNGLQFTLNP